MQMKNASLEIPQYSLRSLFALTLFVAVIVAMIVAAKAALKLAFYRTPNQQAIDQVRGLDGIAMEDTDGLFTVSLCGKGIRVDDTICTEICICQEIQKLTIAQAQITDGGVIEVSKLKNLVHLNLIRCAAVTDRSVQVLGQMSGLTELCISQTGITEMGCASLRQMLPNCKIHD